MSAPSNIACPDPAVLYRPNALAPPLTFGVELEFLLASNYAPNPDPDPSNPIPLHRSTAHSIHDRDDVVPDRGFNRALLWSAVWHVGNFLVSKGLRVVVEYSFQAGEADAYMRDGYWVVKTDCSLEEPEEDMRGYDEWCAIEVVSPVFIASAESFKTVGKVVRWLGMELRSMVNDSCGLHVHVGNGENGFDTTWLRNLMLALWAYEPAFQSFHKGREHSEHAWSMRYAYFNTTGNYKYDAADILHVLHSLAAARTVQECLQYARLHCCAYRFGNPGNEAERFGKKTIEWRQHAGTLQEYRVLRWVRWCVRFVEWSRDVDFEELRMCVEREVRRQGGGLGHTRFRTLTEMLGLGDGWPVVGELTSGSYPA